MAKFWLLVSRVPKDVVLVEQKACDRMAKPGFMWAPKSFMSIAAGMMDGPSDALVTGQGLQAEFFVYRFGESGVVRGWPFACLNPSADFYTMVQVKEGTRQERQSFQGDAVACLGDPKHSSNVQRLELR